MSTFRVIFPLGTVCRDHAMTTSFYCFFFSTLLRSFAIASNFAIAYFYATTVLMHEINIPLAQGGDSCQTTPRVTQPKLGLNNISHEQRKPWLPRMASCAPSSRKVVARRATSANTGTERTICVTLVSPASCLNRRSRSYRHKRMPST